MASTNKTTNYELSQFLGTDKPAWLSDYNQDMSKIDAQMKLNADGVTTATGSATTANTSIGTLASLTTTAKTDLVSAVNEVDNNADTAQNTANLANTTATNAKSVADALSAYLSITNTGDITTAISGGTLDNLDNLHYALNAAGTLGKIYGRYRFTKTGTNATLTLTVSGLEVASQFTITSGAYYVSYRDATSNGINNINSSDLVVNTDGTITISFGSNIAVGDKVLVWLPPCLYFFTDFGDVVVPE